MASRSRRLRVLLLLAALAAVSAVYVLRTRFVWDASCTLARRELPRLLGADVGIGRCEVDPLARSVRLSGVSVFPVGGEEPVFSADSVEVTLAGIQPFFGRLEVDRIRVTRPRLRLDFSRRAPVGAPPSGCPLAVLERTSIRELDVKGLEASIRLPEGRRMEVLGLELGWKTRRRAAEFHLQATQGTVDPGRGMAPFALAGLTAEGSLSPGGRELEITRAEVSLDEVNLALSGKIEDLCRPNLALEAQLFLPLRAATQALGNAQPASGHLWAQLSINGRPPELRLSGELLGRATRLGQYEPGDFDARFSVAGRELTVQELRVPAGTGSIRASGTIRLVPGLPLKARAELDGASFAHVLAKAGVPRAWVEFSASGRVEASGKLAPAPQLSGPADLRVSRFRLTNHPADAPDRGPPLLAFPEGTVTLDLHVLPDRVELLHAQLRVGRARAQADASLFYAAGGALSISGTSDALVLADVGPLAGAPWAGVGSSRFTLSGPFSKVQIRAGLTVRDFEISRFSLGTLQGNLRYDDQLLAFTEVSGARGRSGYAGEVGVDFHGRAPALRLDVGVPDGRVEDLVEIVAPLSTGFAAVRRVLTGSARGKVRLEGPLDALSGRFAFTTTGVVFQGRRFGEGRVSFRLVDGVLLALDPSELRGPLGNTAVDGSLTFDGPLDYRFRVEHLSVEELLGPDLLRRAPLRGAMTLQGHLRGSADAPELEATLLGPALSLSGRSLGATSLRFHGKGEQMEVDGQPVTGAQLTSTFRLRRPFAYQATLSLALPELRPFLPDAASAQGVSGILDGQIQLAGTLADAWTARGTAHVDRLRLGRGDFRVENDGRWELGFDERHVETDGVALRGPDTQLLVAGSAGAKLLDLRASGRLDLRLVESFIAGLERTTGRLELSGTAHGPPGDPSLVGTALLQEASFTVRDQPYDFRGLSGRVDFSDSRVLWNDLQGTLNDGRFASHGDVVLRRFAPQRVEVTAQLDGVSIRSIEDTPFAATGELLLSGNPSSLTLGGDLDVQRLRYDRPFDYKALIGRVAKPRAGIAGAASAGRSSEWLALDVGLHLKDARVENNLARGRILGDVRLTGTNLHPGLLGTLEAGGGSQAFFRGNAFAITDGVVNFKDRRGLDGVFDVHADTQVREYVVRLHAFGRLSQPQILLSSEPGLAEGDVLSLLTLGVTSRDKSNTAGTGAGLAAEALYQASGLDRQVQRFLPKNAVLRDLSIHIATLYNDASGLVEPTAQLESKFLTEQLKLTVSQPVSGKGTRAGAEYRFDQRLSAQIQWDNEYIDFPLGNLGLDLKLRWEVE